MEAKLLIFEKSNYYNSSATLEVIPRSYFFIYVSKWSCFINTIASDQFLFEVASVTPLQEGGEYHLNY